MITAYVSIADAQELPTGMSYGAHYSAPGQSGHYLSLGRETERNIRASVALSARQEVADLDEIEIIAWERPDYEPRDECEIEDLCIAALGAEMELLSEHR